MSLSLSIFYDRLVFCQLGRPLSTKWTLQFPGAHLSSTMNVSCYLLLSLGQFISLNERAATSHVKNDGQSDRINTQDQLCTIILSTCYVFSLFVCVVFRCTEQKAGWWRHFWSTLLLDGSTGLLLFYYKKISHWLLFNIFAESFHAQLAAFSLSLFVNQTWAILFAFLLTWLYKFYINKLQEKTRYHISLPLRSND